MLRNREEIIETYAARCVDNMDMDTVCTFAQEQLEAMVSEKSDEEVLELINEFYPEILEEFPQE